VIALLLGAFGRRAIITLRAAWRPWQRTGVAVYLFTLGRNAGIYNNLYTIDNWARSSRGWR
jgi:hypothetical protein